MREYACQASLRRVLIRLPLATPRVAALWLSIATPLYASIGRELAESLRNDTLVCGERAREVFPIRPRGFRRAIARALANEDREFAETRWSDALSAHRGQTWGGVTFGRRAVASRRIRIAVSPQRAFAPIQRIGGKTGWYYANSFWRLRGLLDKLVGGVGLRRGRRDPVRLAVGDTLDFWRVQAFEQDHLLRLEAEMKAPGVSGSNSRSTATQPDRLCARRRSSTLTVSQGSPIGMRSTQFTTSFSRGCCARSNERQLRARHRPRPRQQADAARTASRRHRGGYDRRNVEPRSV
jgi:hypothetical protein